jgi:hypothetical protein
MTKRKAGSQIGNLTPDHGKLGIDSITLRVSVMQHIIGKVSTRAIILLKTSSQLEVCTRSYEPAKLWESQRWQFRDPIWESRDKMPFGCNSHREPIGRCRVYYMGEGGGFPRV